MPTAFGPSAQDLVSGNYLSSVASAVPLYVLATPGSKLPPTSLQLLSHIPDPRIVIPVQDAVFDSSDPFFVLEPSRVGGLRSTLRGSEVARETTIRDNNKFMLVSVIIGRTGEAARRYREEHGIPQPTAEQLQ